MKAVINTPAVASTTPSPNTGRISDILVSMPPENRIIHRAKVPMNWASEAL